MRFWSDKQNVNGKDTATPTSVIGKDATGAVGSSAISTGLFVDGGAIHAGPHPAPGADIWCSPTGSDTTGSGAYTAPYQTGYKGYLAIVAGNGGILHLHKGTRWGGPVVGGGLWLRGDGAAYDVGGNPGGGIPGWLPIVSCVFDFIGWTPGAFFDQPGQSEFYGGSNDPADHRTKPAVWVCAGSSGRIVEFRNCSPHTDIGGGGAGDNPLTPWRLGWDYPRNADGSLQYLQITGASRASGATVLSVTLPNPGLQAVSAVRVGNVVTITLPRPSGLATFPAWDQDVKIWIQSSDANFPSGAYKVTNPQFNLDFQNQWGFDYSDAVSHTTSLSGTLFVRSIQVQAGDNSIYRPDFIDLESTDPNFPSAQYKVSDVSISSGSAGTITIVDLYGGTHGLPSTATGTAIGQLVKQERGLAEITPPTLTNCRAVIPNDDVVSRYRAGPSLDIGGINAGPMIINDATLGGYFPTPASGNAWDEERMAAIFAYGGNRGFTNLKMARCYGGHAEVRVITGPGNGSIVIDLLSDSGDGYHPPIYHATMEPTYELGIIRADVADTPGPPIVDGRGVDPLLTWGENIPEGTQAAGTMEAIGSFDQWQSGTFVKTPAASGQTGIWRDSWIAGKHPSSPQNAAVVLGRYANLIGGPSTWTITGATTPNVPGWFTQASATRLTDDGVHQSQITLRSTTDTFFGVGGRWVMGVWVNLHTPTAWNGQFLLDFFSAGDLRWKGFSSASWSRADPARVTGWKFVAFWNDTTAGSASQSYVVALLGPRIGTGATMDIDRPFSFWVPPGFDDNDISEYLNCLSAIPSYLKPGMAGTYEGVPLIAHGGIGVDASVLATPAGPAGLPTKNLPLGDSGMTFQGYIPVLAVNSPLPGDFVASGASHAHGYVPDPGASAGTTKFLREDATFAVPPGAPLDGKVLVSNADTTRDYLDSKVESTSGNISVTIVSGGGNEKLNLNVLEGAGGVAHFYQSNLVFGDFTGTWWLISSNDTSKTRGGPGRTYWGNPVGFVVGTVRLQIAIFTNTITGTSPVMTFNITKNGVDVASTALAIAGSSGTLDWDSGEVSGLSSSVGDVWGVNFESAGVFTNGSMTFTATASYYR